MRTSTKVTYQETVSNFNRPLRPSFVQRQIHHVPDGDLCIPIRRLPIRSSVPANDDAEAAYVARGASVLRMNEHMSYGEHGSYGGHGSYGELESFDEHESFGGE